VKNPYTTIAGYLTIAITVAQYLVSFASTHTWPPSAMDIVALIAGIGLVLAKDGGH
jgi:hypothetical protein